MATATVAAADRIAAVLATRSRWTHATRKSDGREFFIVPGSNGATYYTSTTGCTCPAARNSRDGFCKHQAAVRQATAPVAEPKPCKAKGCTRTAGRSGRCAPCTAAWLANE